MIIYVTKNFLVFFKLEAYKTKTVISHRKYFPRKSTCVPEILRRNERERFKLLYEGGTEIITNLTKQRRVCNWLPFPESNAE